MTASLQPLHIRSALMYSPGLSNNLGAHVYLKLDNTQPSGSFKNRGIGHLAQRSIHPLGPSRTTLICSSGGNAGLACATAAVALGTKCEVFVPVTAAQRVVDRLVAMGVKVVQGGAFWAEADASARLRVAELEGAVYIPPFDHPTIIEGHASLIQELEEQLVEHNASKLAAVIASVGGGGLLAGLLYGMEASQSRLSCPLLACETSGAASLALGLKTSYEAGGAFTPATFAPIKTIATSLGCGRVSDECLKRCLAHDAQAGAKGEEGVVSIVMDDARTLAITRKFTDDHAFFVEPACSASLLPIYEQQVLQAALPNVQLAQPGQKPPPDAPSVVVIVCGGNTISLELVEKWEKEFAEQGVGLGDVRVQSRQREVVLKL